MVNLFDIVDERLFSPLNGKFKRVYADSLRIIMDKCGSELSYAVDREEIVACLVDYFDNQTNIDLTEDNEEQIIDSKGKANKVIRVLKSTGWIDEEVGKNRTYRLNMTNYALTICKSSIDIIKDEEIEYQSYAYSINALLNSEELKIHPYAHVIKMVKSNTESLLHGLKKLSSNIKRQISTLTKDLQASEIINNYLSYLEGGISKAYNRMKTNDNLDFYKASIIKRLHEVLENREILDIAIKEYIEIENIESSEEAEEKISEIVYDLITTFNDTYNAIKKDIENKHKKYLDSAVERAKYLLASGENTADKIKVILNSITTKLQTTNDIYLSDEYSKLFNIFSQQYIDNDSFSPIYIRKKIAPQEAVIQNNFTQEELENILLDRKAQNSNAFTKKNINKHVMEVLSTKDSILASQLTIESKRDLLRVIFINMYAINYVVDYEIETTNEMVMVSGYKFYDFMIRRK